MDEQSVLRLPGLLLSYNTVTCRGCCVTYKTGFGLEDWIYWSLTHTTRNYRQYSAIAIPHTSQFTVTRALGFSVLTSRILATDLSQSHCHYKSHMKSSFQSNSLRSIIPQLQIPKTRLDSIQFLCSQAHILADWRLEIRLFTSRLLTLMDYSFCSAEHFLITNLHGPHGKHSLYC
jgi:hypothetical protein